MLAVLEEDQKEILRSFFKDDILNKKGKVFVRIMAYHTARITGKYQRGMPTENNIMFGNFYSINARQRSGSKKQYLAWPSQYSGYAFDNMSNPSSKCVIVKNRNNNTFMALRVLGDDNVLFPNAWSYEHWEPRIRYVQSLFIVPRASISSIFDPVIIRSIYNDDIPVDLMRQVPIAYTSGGPNNLRTQSHKITNFRNDLLNATLLLLTYIKGALRNGPTVANGNSNLLPITSTFENQGGSLQGNHSIALFDIPERLMIDSIKPNLRRLQKMIQMSIESSKKRMQEDIKNRPGTGSIRHVFLIHATDKTTRSISASNIYGENVFKQWLDSRNINAEEKSSVITYINNGQYVQQPDIQSYVQNTTEDTRFTVRRISIQGGPAAAYTIINLWCPISQLCSEDVEPVVANTSFTDFFTQMQMRHNTHESDTITKRMLRQIAQIENEHFNGRQNFMGEKLLRYFTLLTSDGRDVAGLKHRLLSQDIYTSSIRNSVTLRNRDDNSAGVYAEVIGTSEVDGAGRMPPSDSGMWQEGDRYVILTHSLSTTHDSIDDILTDTPISPLDKKILVPIQATVHNTEENTRQRVNDIVKSLFFGWTRSEWIRNIREQWSRLNRDNSAQNGFRNMIETITGLYKQKTLVDKMPCLICMERPVIRSLSNRNWWKNTSVSPQIQSNYSVVRTRRAQFALLRDPSRLLGHTEKSLMRLTIHLSPNFYHLRQSQQVLRQLRAQELMHSISADMLQSSNEDLVFVSESKNSSRQRRSIGRRFTMSGSNPMLYVLQNGEFGHSKHVVTAYTNYLRSRLLMVVRAEEGRFENTLNNDTYTVVEPKMTLQHESHKRMLIQLKKVNMGVRYTMLSCDEKLLLGCIGWHRSQPEGSKDELGGFSTIEKYRRMRNSSVLDILSKGLLHDIGFGLQVLNECLLSEILGQASQYGSQINRLLSETFMSQLAKINHRTMTEEEIRRRLSKYNIMIQILQALPNVSWNKAGNHLYLSSQNVSMLTLSVVQGLESLRTSDHPDLLTYFESQQVGQFTMKVFIIKDNALQENAVVDNKTKEDSKRSYIVDHTFYNLPFEYACKFFQHSSDSKRDVYRAVATPQHHKVIGLLWKMLLIHCQGDEDVLNARLMCETARFAVSSARFGMFRYKLAFIHGVLMFTRVRNSGQSVLLPESKRNIIAVRNKIMTQAVGNWTAVSATSALNYNSIASMLNTTRPLERHMMEDKDEYMYLLIFRLFHYGLSS